MTYNIDRAFEGNSVNSPFNIRLSVLKANNEGSVLLLPMTTVPSTASGSEQRTASSPVSSLPAVSVSKLDALWV